MDDIVFELRRNVRGEKFTYGELYYEGKEIAKTLEPKRKKGVKAQQYPIGLKYSYCIRAWRLYLIQINDKGNPIIRGSVFFGKKYKNGHYGLCKKANEKVLECYIYWLKKHPTCKNEKINIIDDFDV